MQNYDMSGDKKKKAEQDFKTSRCKGPMDIEWEFIWAPETLLIWEVITSPTLV